MSDKASSKFEKFIAILKQELELTGTEVADILWLAKQRQIKLERTSNSNEENVASDTLTAPATPEQTATAENKLNQPVSNSNSGAQTSPTANKPIQSAYNFNPGAQTAATASQQTTEAEVGVYTKSTSGKSLAIKLPDAPGLPQPLKLARALRPLIQKINSGTEVILDEEATANRIAEERICAPVLQPALEPAFDLILVVDESNTMIFWQKTIQELRKLLEIQGAFRDVQIWGLLTNEEGDIYLRRGTSKTSRKHRHYQPRFLVDPSGKRLFLIASDCVADIWHNGKAFSMLKIWARTNIVAIIQMLPQWLWQRTGLNLGAKVQFASLTPRIANQNLLIKKILLWSDVDLSTGTKIPIFTLEENSAKTWSKMIAGKSGASVIGFVIPSNFTPSKEEPQTLQPEQIVSNFRRTATPTARKLASLLSAAPVITLPIVRIIQAQMLKESQQVHVAEVFLGGILKRKEENTPETNPDEIEFNFINEEIRNNFLQAAPITESLEIIHSISQYFANKINKTLTEFNALLTKPKQALNENVDIKPFALLTAKILKRLGGEYVKFAEEIEQTWNNLELFHDNEVIDGGAAHGVQPPVGWQLECTMTGHNGLISRVEWAPNGILLASTSFDRTIKLWNLSSGECVNTLTGHEGRVWAVAWSPDSKFIASGSTDKTVRVWNSRTGELVSKFDIAGGTCLNMEWSPDGELIAAGGIGDNWSIIIRHVKTQTSQILEGHTAQVNSVAWSPDGKILASVSHDTTIRLWDRETLELKKILTGHNADVHSVNWAPDGSLLATASLDNTIRLWNPHTGQTILILEGHTASVNCVEFSHDGTFLASKSSDSTVRLWRCDTWETVTILSEEALKSLPFGLAFHPTQPILATLGEADIAIRIWKLDALALLYQSPANPYNLYRNAKVVLVGESGVGKTALSLVLTNKEFRATESTHGRDVWTFDRKELDLGNNHKEIREILLWDLAGQPAYRLIHQLYLNELAVALIVCDARSETDPFAGVYYWNRALLQAEKLQRNSGAKLKKFLVTTRADRGSVSVSKARIDEIVQKLGFDGYFETSAKEDWNIKELAQAIIFAVDWENIPQVISTQLFQKTKVFLIQEKQEERLLSPVDDLFRSFVQSTNEPNSEQLRQEFNTCILLSESRDLIRRLSFGNLVLLQPELLDAYALAIINAAKDQPEGLGFIAEDSVLAGKFRMPFAERIKDKNQEKLLLIATVEELFAREIALREQSDTGSLLVFPSQITREWPEAPDPEGKAVILEFEGAVAGIYTTLAVRLSRSEFFKCKEMWKNAAIFEARVGGECGIWLRYIGNTDEGKAELTLFFKPEASAQTRLQFEEYVYTHLKRRALPETIVRRRIIVCQECGASVNESHVVLRKKRGFDWISCGVCDAKISLLDDNKHLQEPCIEIPKIIPEMDKAADKGRERDTATSIIKGKEATNDFDVFLSYNSKDKPLVEKIAVLLRQRGLNPWLDKAEISPGMSFQEYIIDGIKQSKSAAVFVSPNGLGGWQEQELVIINNRRIKKNLPVIPVLLPGIDVIPDQPNILLLFSELNWLSFKENVDELEPLEQLIQAIKGLYKD